MTNLSDFIDNDQEYRPWNIELSTFCMLMHLSQFAGFIIPLGGYVLPIIMWAVHKDKSVVIDQHGKNILNWMITFFIYICISCVLILLVVGIFSLVILSVLTIIFTIIGAIKAANKELYRYPLTINFIK
jgi:uncharacterized Tic20 family protein